MELPYDREKLLDSMFDPITSLLLAELENGPKNSSYLAEKSSISENEVLERFSYLVECNFLEEKKTDGQTIFSANEEKLGKLVEEGENFGAAIEGLEKMDSFLN